MEGTQDIFEAAIDYFSHMFTEQNSGFNMQILRNCENLITDEDNHLMQKIPDEEEIKEVIFSMDPSSSTGPYSFNSHFCHVTWDIIKGCY